MKYERNIPLMKLSDLRDVSSLFSVLRPWKPLNALSACMTY